MKLVFLGPPGAGKGTQAEKMAEEFNLLHASTGDIFREAVASGSELGRTVEEYLDGGKLVPDELTSRVVERMVIEKHDDFVLDGYPRTIQQGEDLERMLRVRDRSLDGVVFFALGDETAVQRLTGRLVCTECGHNYHETFLPPEREGVCDECGGELKQRSDSSEEVVRRRLEEYHRKTEPLVGFYEARDLLEKVDAAPPPAEVKRQTMEVLEQFAQV